MGPPIPGVSSTPPTPPGPRCCPSLVYIGDCPYGGSTPGYGVWP